VKPSVLGFFLARYEGIDPLELRQVRSLLFTLVGVGAGSLAVCLALRSAPAIRAATLALAIVTIILAFVVKFGLARPASVATTVIISCLFLAIPFLQKYRGEYEVYLLTTMQCFALIVTGLIARERWQSLLVMAAGLAGVTADYLLRVYPDTGSFAHVSDPITCVLVLVIGTFIERGVRERSIYLLRKAEEEARRSQAQVERLERAIVSSGDALGLGAAVKASAARTEGLIAGLMATLRKVEEEVRGLQENTQAIAGSQAAIAASSRVVHDKISDQSAVVAESSAAVEEMTASINGIADIATARREAVRQLKSATDTGTGEMAKAAEAVQSVKESADSIVGVVNVIRAVASRTNLLAMNAAIEAAHAGQAGKGFSVVADEIRKLSEETGRNVKIIAASIKGTLAAIKTAGEVNERAQEIFRAVSGEADSVASSMEEIGRGLSELSQGSGEILEGVSQSVQITQVVKDSALGMDDSIAVSARNIAALESTTRSIDASLEAALGRFAEMEAEAEALSKAGKDNEEGLRGLAEALAAIKT
jgi:methyl-accepting chemotaxis protein